jgi:hypothetical protein
MCRSIVDTYDWWGCSQNSLTTEFPTLTADCPQVKGGSTHSRSEAICPPKALGIERRSPSR